MGDRSDQTTADSCRQRVFGAQDAALSEKEQKELAKLQGTWAVVSVERDGKPLKPDEIKNAKLVINGANYTLTLGEETIQGTYKLQPAKNPKAIDANRTKGPDQGKTVQGIYQLDGDTLKMCYHAPGKDSRPTAFATKADSGHALYVFKKAKP